MSVVAGPMPPMLMSGIGDHLVADRHGQMFLVDGLEPELEGEVFARVAVVVDVDLVDGRAGPS